MGEPYLETGDINLQKSEPYMRKGEIELQKYEFDL